MSTQRPNDPAPFDGPADGIGYPLDPPTSTSDAGPTGTTGPAGTAAPVAPTYGTPAESPEVLVPTPLPSRGGLSRSKIMAATPILATIGFFVCGFAFNGWAWAWVFWLAVPLVGILTSDDDDQKRLRRERKRGTIER